MFHNGLLVRKAAYAAVGPFRTDLARSEDYEMALRLARGHKGVYVPKVVFLQRRHGGVRGTACEQFNPDRHAEKAIGYDKLIFRELYETLPLLEYGRELRALPAEAAKRGALLQRACVYARRKLWDISLEDLRRAARLEAAGTLTSQERRICRRFLLSKYGCDEVVTEPWIGDALRNLAAEGGLGRDMVRAVTQPLLWRAREALMQNRWRFCAAFLTLLISVHGYRGTAAMLFSSVKRRAFAAELGSFGTR